jgi:lysophospholipid acyltransferase (LPLAT)-like uncharacterized protein
MSGASDKTSWAEMARIRKYGEREPGEFSITQRLLFAATSAAARLFVRASTDTCHWQGVEPGLRQDLLLGRTHVIFLVWHNRVPAFFPWLASLSRRDWRFRCDAMVSGSKDGELLARPIRESGGVVIRGSSSKDATAALRGAVEAAAEGANIATVGDGPRGPRYRLKPGPVLIAKATGLPVVPVTWVGSRVLQLHRSWDQLMLPLPFSRIEFRFGEPYQVAADADARGIATARRELEKRMGALTEWADANTRVAIQFPKPKPGEVLRRRPEIELAGRHVE